MSVVAFNLVRVAVVIGCAVVTRRAGGFSEGFCVFLAALHRHGPAGSIGPANPDHTFSAISYLAIRILGAPEGRMTNVLDDVTECAAGAVKVGQADVGGFAQTGRRAE